MGYKVAQIEALQEKLAALPEISDVDREVTKQEAIRRMASSITSLQTRGYSIEKIADILTAEGMQITVQTLKSYLTRAKQVARNSPRSKGATEPGPSQTSRRATAQASSIRPPARPVTTPKEESLAPARSSSFTPRQDSDEL